MKAIFRMTLMTLALGSICMTAQAAASDDPIMRAMSDELGRSMKQLVIPGMPAPYFMSYRVVDSESATVEARYGGLVEADTSRDRYFYIEVRVGDPQFDNTYFIGSWQDVYNMRRDLPEENDYQSLRHEIWLYTDAAYKNALENLARKRSYLQAHPVQEEIPDFSPAESYVYTEEPVDLKARLATWEAEVRKAAQVLREFRGLQDWKVNYFASAMNRRYLNSEGSQHLRGALHENLQVVATGQSADGQRLTAAIDFTTRGGDSLPTGDKLQAAVRGMGGELVAMLSAPSTEEYAGPVLFDGPAATQFITQLFVDQLTPVRKPLTSVEWMEQQLPDPKLPGRLQRRVFPDFVTVTDEPSRASWQGLRLAGQQTVDDEGVRSQDITLVTAGRLVNLPMGRQPMKKITQTNGHARTLPNQWTLPTITNLFVKTDKPQKDMVAELRRLAGDFGNDYGLLITRLDDPTVSRDYARRSESESQNPELLSAPVIAYKVYVKDGRREPIRGLTFDEVSIRTLRDIAAMGKDAPVVNLMLPTEIMDARYPATISTPSILVEEMELKADTEREPLPLSENPLFAK